MMRPGIFQRTTLTLLAAALALVFLLPFLWMLSSSLRPQSDIFASLSPLTVHALVPRELTLENFQILLDGPYPRAVLNSLVVAGGTVTFGLLICALAAFALAAMDFPFRDTVFAVVVVSFLIPFEGIAIPLSDLFRSWGLDNTYAGLILPGTANGLAIFLLRQFFLGVPAELRQAARVDGASWWGIFWRIYLPLARPALIGGGLLLFTWQWQSYLWPLLITSQQSMDVAPVALAKYLGQFDFEFGQLFAGAVIISLIPALILLPLQRYFTQSVASTGMKE
ncbi:MAG: carbohydrate ABC transporter permease [Chloroflexota bacterium]